MTRQRKRQRQKSESHALLPRTVATVPIVRHVATHAYTGARTRPRSALNTVPTVATVRDSSGSQTHLSCVRARKARNPTSTWPTTLARVPPLAKYRRYVRPAGPCATRAILGPPWAKRRDVAPPPIPTPQPNQHGG